MSSSNSAPAAGTAAAAGPASAAGSVSASVSASATSTGRAPITPASALNDGLGSGLAGAAAGAGLAGMKVAPDNVAKLNAIARDFRTDTITVPTEEMFEAMRIASRGDDVYGEDETTNAFQDKIAALTGKEAAMFVVSGTLSNQLALRTHLQQPPYSVLCDARAHIHRYEAGGVAFHSGAAVLPITPSNGHHLTLEADVLPNLVLGDDVHSAPTRVISLENTLNGLIFPQTEIRKIANEARKHDVRMHLDGARLWNVAQETGTSIRELCEPFDTVSLCLSKGLGAPIGSILVGPAAFIAKARHFRKLFGAGTRQTGSLVAAADVALERHLPLLRGTHELARWIQQELEALGVLIVSPAETSMLFIDTSPLDLPIWELTSRAASLPVPLKLGGARIVIHHQTDPKAAQDLVELVRTIRAEKEQEREKKGLEPLPAPGMGTGTGAGRKIGDVTQLYAGMSEEKAQVERKNAPLNGS